MYVVVLTYSHYLKITIIITCLYIIASDAKELLTHHHQETPEVDLHHVMEEASKGYGGRWDEKAREEGEWKSIPQKLEKKEIQEVSKLLLISFCTLSLYVGVCRQIKRAQLHNIRVSRLCGQHQHAHSACTYKHF